MGHSWIEKDSEEKDEEEGGHKSDDESSVIIEVIGDPEEALKGEEQTTD